MQTALREVTIDENDIVHFIEVCYCLDGEVDSTDPTQACTLTDIPDYCKGYKKGYSDEV